MDIWKQAVQKEIEDIKTDIRRLQDKQLLHDQEIKGIRESLTEIKDGIKWLQRTITGGLIMAGITGVAGVFWAAINI